MAYNGWTNRETWQVNLWYGDYFHSLGNDEAPGSGYPDAILLREIVAEELDAVRTHKGGLLEDIVGSFLSAVDWYELSEAYQPEDEEEDGGAACEDCGNRLNDGSDRCDQCGGYFK